MTTMTALMRSMGRTRRAPCSGLPSPRAAGAAGAVLVLAAHGVQAQVRQFDVPAQPLAPRGNTSVSLSAPITVNAPPGMDAREIAALIESRLRTLMRETTRSPAAAMYD